MAKKTNKTDHVLNLLSSGKKNSKEDNDAPPVDLRRKAPEPDSDDPFETHLPEPKMTMQKGEDETELPEPHMSPLEEDSQPPEPHMSESVLPEERPAVVAVTSNVPSVSVVHTSDEENSIAEAVKDSLEAEFNEYLKEKEELEGKLDEKLEEIVAQQEQVIEWQPLKPKEPAEINVFELLGRDEESEEEVPAEEPEPMAEPTQEMLESIVGPESTQSDEADAEPESIPEASEPAAEGVSDQEPEALEGPEPTVEEVHESEMASVAVAEPEELETAMEPVVETKPVEETKSEAVEPAEPEIIENATSNAEPEPVQQKEEPMEQPKTEEKDYVTVNVMEHLVRDQAPKYIRQFGHCDCDRCIEDTVALTLTHLPSKYVVVNKNAVSPLLNFYEKKYAGQLIVEITKATMIVNESPHH